MKASRKKASSQKQGGEKENLGHIKLEKVFLIL